MAAKEKMLASLATKYGIVEDGKHKDCLLALGTDPKEGKKIEAGATCTQILFINKEGEQGRYNINGDFKHIELIGYNKETGYELNIVFNNGDSSRCFLRKAKQNIVIRILNGLLKTQHNTAIDKWKDQYGLTRDFIMSIESCLTKESLKQAIEFIQAIQALLDKARKETLDKLQPGSPNFDNEMRTIKTTYKLDSDINESLINSLTARYERYNA